MFQSKLKLLKSSFFISFFNTVSTVLAFFVQLVLAKRFGASIDMDAYFAAIVVPTFLVKLLGNPLSMVFVPLYKDTKHNKKAHVANNFYGSLFWGFTTFYFIAAVAVYVAAYQISALIIPGADAHTILLTSQLLKVAAMYIFFLGVYYVMVTLHTAEDQFFWPYLGNALSSFVLITYTLFFIKEQGIFAAMYALLYGAITQAVIAFIFLPKSIRFIPSFDKKIYGGFLKLFLPLGIGSLIFKSTPLIDKYFVSFLHKGDISVVSYGQKFLESINGFLAMGLSVVLLSITSAHAAKKNEQDFANTLSWGLRATGLLIVPTAAYLLFFSSDLIRALFERGNFTPGLTLRVGQTLAGYAGALLGLAIGSQLTNIFYAKKKHLLVVIINLALVIPYVGAVYLLSKTAGVKGVAYAYSGLSIVTVSIYLVFGWKYIQSELSVLSASFIKFLFASGVMILVLFVLNRFIATDTHSLVRIVMQAATGVAVYGALLLILQAKEITPITSRIFNKLFLKSKKAI